MNAAVRFVAGLGPRDHTSDAQREQHWLPIEQRITYKLCVLMHAVETGTAPEYISDMAKPVSVLEGRAYVQLRWGCTTYHAREPLSKLFL